MAKHQLKTSAIYCGDNLEMLKDVPDESVDLIYIDPPFNSNRNYEVFWSDSQEKRAFDDRFGDAEAYISYMRPRIAEMHRVLKVTGSFYYHCDWHASHYVKIMLDQVFGFNNFRNEIVWYYKRWTAASKTFQRMHDTIFFYSKTNEYTFNKLKQPFLEKTTVAKFKRKVEEGRIVQDKEHLMERNPDEGVAMHDVWEIPFIHPMAKERLGYPTQKPLALLERVIEASSNEGDVILDAFCGCGTALVAAQKLGRKEIPPFEFENWAVIALGGIPNRAKVGDYGIDGKLYPIERQKEKSDEKNLFGDVDTYYPIQVKQKDKVGRPDIDAFETAMRRDKRRKGYFISFDFSEDAMKEIRRLDKEGDLEIIPVTVKELLDKSGFERE